MTLANLDAQTESLGQVYASFVAIFVEASTPICRLLPRDDTVDAFTGAHARSRGLHQLRGRARKEVYVEVPVLQTLTQL